MTTLVISDFHGENPTGLIKTLKNMGVEKIVSLGDFDDPKIFQDLMNVHIDKRTVIGNHDSSFVHGDEIYSPLLSHSSLFYIGLWESFPKEKEFILKTERIKLGRKNGRKILDKLNGRRVIYLHGALYDSRQGKNGNSDLWGRLFDDGEYSEGHNIRENLKIMREKDIWLLFRGHDHFPRIFSQEDKAQDFEQIQAEKDKINLCNDKRYIISLGAFAYGHYLIFDEQNLTVNFLNTKQ